MLSVSELAFRAVCVVTIFNRVVPVAFFDHIDFPRPSSASNTFFGPGVDFKVIQGEPHKKGCFRAVFPFCRFISLESIRQRFTVLKTCGGVKVRQTVRLEKVLVNPAFAKGCWAAWVVEEIVPVDSQEEASDSSSIESSGSEDYDGWGPDGYCPRYDSDGNNDLNLI